MQASCDTTTSRQRAFTRRGFQFDGESFVSRETVTGNADSIDEVIVTAVLSGSTLTVKSDYLKQGEKVVGHAAVYNEAPDAVVKLR